MITIRTAALAAFTILGLAALPAAAQPHHHGMPADMNAGDHEAFFAHLADALGLTDAQRASAKKIHEELAAKATPIQDKARALHDEIDQLLEVATPDPTAIGNKMIAMHGLHKQLAALHEQGKAR